MTRLLRTLKALWTTSALTPLLEPPPRPEVRHEGPAPPTDAAALAATPGLKLGTGRAWPMGASCDAEGVNFAVFSAHAQAVELCIFDATGTHEVGRSRLPGHSGDVWHGHLAGGGPGLIYGLRVHGPWRPDKGHVFNPAKLLLDPYAREIVGRFEWSDEHFAGSRPEARQPDPRDNAATALKARVVHDEPSASRPPRPHTPLADSVLYELHVKGFSKLNPAVPEALRGTYAGLGHAASVAHLKRLGVTAVSLLPVHYRVDEERLHTIGLSNYWGYNTIGFFAPEPRLGCAAPAGGDAGQALRDEFRAMVDALHAAGIEVILDVVFNHSAEGGRDGPSLSFKGLDNAAYYRPHHDDPLHWKDGYDNITGCGNTFDLRHPRVLQMVMDSLRYWVQAMGVDGYRFDLAPVLGRGDHGFDRRAQFFAAVAQDPVLAGVKMIAEPWDIGPGGYQVGGFPNGWAEWNDKFRDDVRAFWLRHPSNRGAFAQRLCASSDVYQAQGRAPAESVNYVVSHDGYTLRDLLTYQHKRNEANGEDNRDGHGHNLGHNCGAEGPSDDPAVVALRGRLQRALLATTLLAQGTPMLCAGDELGHTQQGNNNPYCQDGPLTWIDWSSADDELIAYTQRVIELRHTLRPFADHWYTGHADAHGVHDLTWLTPEGHTLHGHAWQDGHSRAFGCLIGKPGRAEGALLLLVNAKAKACEFRLTKGAWRVVLDSTQALGVAPASDAVSAYALPAASVVLLSAGPASVT